jgi:hypothetical protein
MSKIQSPINLQNKITLVFPSNTIVLEEKDLDRLSTALKILQELEFQAVIESNALNLTTLGFE